MSKPPDDDLFAAMARSHGPLPAGEYFCQLITAVPFSTEKTKGVTAVVKIVAGEWSGREVHLRLLEFGPEFLRPTIARDVEALRTWWEAATVEGRPSQKDGFAGALEAIWMVSQDRRAVLTLGAKPGRDSTTENYLIEVRADEPYDF